MFIGHFAVGFASKRFAARTSLALLIAAPIFLDVLWPIFLALRWEHVRVDPGNTKFTPFDFFDYPWSHSLLMSCMWAIALALAYYAITWYWAGTMAIAVGVVSHWVLDWVTHRPDMPLYPGGPRVGLGLWNSIPATMITEAGMLIAGVWLYANATRARDRIGRFAFAGYVVILLAMYVGDRFSAPPVSTSGIVGTAALLEIVLLAWAWWFDRHRTSSLSELPAGAEG